MQGKFIVFEGGEGSGKSTQLELLALYLSVKGLNVFRTKEPGGTELGQKLREIVLHDKSVDKMTELFIYMADRSHHVKTIKAKLDQGFWVLCDRFSWSTLAYQGYGRGHTISMIEQLNELACQGLKPDWTILLDIDPKIGLARKYKQGETNKFEAENLEFHNRVREGYNQLLISNMWQTETKFSMLHCQSKIDKNRQIAKDVLHEQIKGLIPFSLD